MPRVRTWKGEATVSAVDWSKLSTADVLASLRSAPAIAGPWEDSNTMGGVRLCEGMWKRCNEHPGPRWCSVATVQAVGERFLWSFSPMEPGGNEATKEAAMAAADAALVGLGWRLLGPSEIR
jgi:hypothetical protein